MKTYYYKQGSIAIQAKNQKEADEIAEKKYKIDVKFSKLMGVSPIKVLSHRTTKLSTEQKQ